MKITINERFKPYSHEAGTLTLLPGSGWPIQIFPCLIRIYRSEQELTELNLDLQGPVKQFTLFNDLEKGCLTVSGCSSEGWFRYHLIASDDLENIRFHVDRAPTGRLRIQNETDLFKDSGFVPYRIPACDRLSFGCHKAQDWTLVKRRSSLDEILPFWHRLGQLIPQLPSPEHWSGTLSLLKECEETESCWEKLLLCGFREMLVPQLNDSLHQGIIKYERIENISPLVLLSEGAKLIRKLFIEQSEGSLLILPRLLPCLPFGRLIDVPLIGGGRVSIEWSKKTIRQVMIHSEQEGNLELHFRSNVSSYRLRQHSKDKGERRNRVSVLNLQKNHIYFLDNFM